MKRFAVLAGMVLFGTTSALAQTATLEKVKETGQFTLGYRESSVPFSYLGADQKPVGISIDLCNEVVTAVKEAVGKPDLTIEWVAVNASNRIPLLQNDTIDIECGSTTNTATRQEQVAFSVATFASLVTWLTPQSANIKSEADLKGKTVVVTQGSLNAQVLDKLNAEKGLDLKILRGKEQAESLQLLRSGRAVAWFEDDILQAGLAANAQNSEPLLFLPSSHEVVGYYGLMMRKGDSDFKLLVDKTISAIMQRGDYTRLYAKWFEQPIPPSNIALNLPMSEALKARVASPSDGLDP